MKLDKLASLGMERLHSAIDRKRFERIFWAAPHFSCDCGECQMARITASTEPWPVASGAIEIVPDESVSDHDVAPYLGVQRVRPEFMPRPYAILTIYADFWESATDHDAEPRTT